MLNKKKYKNSIYSKSHSDGTNLWKNSATSE